LKENEKQVEFKKPKLVKKIQDINFNKKLYQPLKRKVPKENLGPFKNLSNEGSLASNGWHP
jgi:hypothetical protein